MLIFKKDTKGKIRVLCINSVEGILVQHSGIVGGKIVTHQKGCKGKNIGKTNETSPTEQAHKEAKALIKKKLREGYFKTIEEAERKDVVMPMLAKSYGDHKSKIDWRGDVFVQPKLDGMRALAFIKDGEVRLMSRKGVEIVTMPHIELSLSGIKGEVVLDGELYAHGLSFQENMKLIKKNRGKDSEAIHFHVYDMISDEKFSNRIVRKYIKCLKHIEEVETCRINGVKQLKCFHSLFLGQGYEGTIIRHGLDGYKKNGRSASLLKYKDFIDEAYTIIDVVPMDAYPEQGVVVCKTKDSKTFKATPKMSFVEREHILYHKDEVVGKTAEIRFFEYTDDGLPRFPIFVGVRLDK